MVDPEMPEVRAELQREDRPEAHPGYDKAGSGLGARPWIWLLFGGAVILVIALAYVF